MNIYMTKTWGFDSPSGPLQFSTAGWRENARALLQPGDLVLIVGTQSEPTAEAERGTLLGLMEPTREIVRSLDFYSLADIRPHERDERGNYRWPFGLHVVRAWQFDEPRPKLTDVAQRAFAMDAALGIVTLTPEEARAVLALPRHEIAVLPLLSRPTSELPGRPRRTAPPPSTIRAGVMHLRFASAYTYAMSIEGADRSVFKIGWAFDYSAREDQFNRASLPDLGGLRYRTALHQYWPTAREAFRMEQSLLRQLDGLRHRQNSEVVGHTTLDELQRAWTECLLRMRRDYRSRPKSSISPDSAAVEAQ